MAAIWPASLPQKPIFGTWQMGLAYPTVEEFQPERGPSLTRPATTAETWRCTGEFHVSRVQRQTLIAFWRHDCRRGALPFYWIDPIEGGQFSWRFDGAQPFNLAARLNSHDRVPVVLLRLPQ